MSGNALIIMLFKQRLMHLINDLQILSKKRGKLKCSAACITCIIFFINGECTQLFQVTLKGMPIIASVLSRQ